jgi:hypothetical protein
VHYDPTAVLHSIDQHKLALVPCALAFVLNYVWFIDGMRIARRERRYSMPIAATYVFMAHDIAYVAHFSRWFGDDGHWFSKLFWVGMALSIVMELILLAQTIRYGHAEHAPAWSQGMWTGAVLAGLVATMTIWWFAIGTFDDHLFLMSLGLVTAAYPPMGMALLLHRRGAAGQTVLMWAAFTALTVMWYPGAAYGFGEQFQSWLWLGLGALTAAWGALNTWLVARARRAPAPLSTSGAAAEPLAASSPSGRL